MWSQEEILIDWPIHSEYCHDGIPLSNGIFGALIWFQTNKIMITINRNDYWDHRGGTEWTKDINYKQMKKYLENDEFEAARNMFRPMFMNGKEKRPTRLPMGRFELELLNDTDIVSAQLNISKSVVTVVCESKDGETFQLELSILLDEPLLIVDGVAPELMTIRGISAFEFPKVAQYYQQFDIPFGTYQTDGKGGKGWFQELPADPANGVWSEWVNDQNAWLLTSVYGPTGSAAIQNGQQKIKEIKNHLIDHQKEESIKSWQQIWEKTANISFPTKEIENIYYLGVYRMLGNSMSGKLAPTLQGPWVEEYRMPPWSNDYHFNINVQECLWPAYAANQTDSLNPLFEMIHRWKNRLEQNARFFVGIDNGYMLNHSTDDTGKPSGGMWTGTIDHANTSWIAQMMWQKYAYTGDEEYLRHDVYPFLKRAMNVYIALMEKDGDDYYLPITVSPEFGGSGPRALGKNSSFFLANIHFLCEKIIETASRFELDEKYVEKIKDIQQHLPLFTTGIWQEMEWPRHNDISDQEIYLWEGQPLDVSHRHHSHLAGIYPFDVIDLHDPVQSVIVKNSIKTWVDKGMGRWSGWSMPWASILHNRVGNKDAAYLMIQLYMDVFMNKGYASQHNASYPGFTQFEDGETMQVEASIAISAAILEMFVQTSRGITKVFSGIPTKIANCSFSGLRAEGAFLISGEMRDGGIKEIRILSEKGKKLLIENPFQSGGYILRADEKIPLIDGINEFNTRENEELRIVKQ